MVELLVIQMFQLQLAGLYHLLDNFLHKPIFLEVMLIMEVIMQVNEMPLKFCSGN